MQMRQRPRLFVAAAVFALAGSWAAAQSNRAPEEFTAVAIQNDNLGSGAGTVLITVDRWSSDADRTRLVTTLQQKGPEKLLDVLQDMRPVGRIRTPDSLGYDLHYAHETKGEDGERRIVIATDRPIGFWEATRRPRTVDYPFTVIQMEIPREGAGKGTLSYATKIIAKNDMVELENYSTQPIMLNEIQARARR